MTAFKTSMIPYEIVVNKIYFIRGQKVMLDRDLAVLYKVETKRLKEAVKRNNGRFPKDFMFEMTKLNLRIGGRNLRPPILISWDCVTVPTASLNRESRCYRVYSTAKGP